MPDFDEKLIKNIQSAPADPGCYIFKNQAGKILYIGKAVNLHNRVRSYFQRSDHKDSKTLALVKRIKDVDFIVTHSEVEALILENTLIKKHRPPYNIFLRDDKSFPYIRITKEDFPRVFLTRRVIQDGSRYFGPYTDVGSIRAILNIIKRLFTLRTCKHRLDPVTIQNKRIRLCLEYHIKNCEGPCQGKISDVDYNIMINKVIDLLQGKTNEIVDYFRDKMKKAAEEQAYETAGVFRDRIQALQSFYRNQYVEIPGAIDRDLITLESEDECGCVVVFRIRKGRLIAKDAFLINGVANYQTAEILRNFIQQYYSTTDSIPSEISVNVKPIDNNLLSYWLSAQSRHKVNFMVPQRGEKIRLMQLAQKNARLHLMQFLANQTQKGDYIPKSLLRLQDLLKLSQLPRKIEAFDISNLQGKYAVASLVTFVNAAPKKSEYRRFRIKTVIGPDDFASMAEVVRRRYERQIKERKELPDLILIDGGKGQLSAVSDVLHRLNLDSLPLLGLAKRLEEIYLPDKSEPIVLPRTNSALVLLQRIRNEAHRFAISYHRRLRNRETLHLGLADIPGLGKNKQQNLIKFFKSISKMRAASIEDLCQVQGIGPELARKVYIYLRR